MNVPDPSSRPLVVATWNHFDGSTGNLHLDPRQCVKGSYTFGASNRCRFTMQFKDLIVPGSTGKAGEPSYFDTAKLFMLSHNYGQAPNGEITLLTASNYADWAAPNTVSVQFSASYTAAGGGFGTSSFMNQSNVLVGDLAAEVFTLVLEIERAPALNILKLDYRSPSIVIVDNWAYNYPNWPVPNMPFPDSFDFYVGGGFPEGMPGPDYEEKGVSNITLLKFYCEDIA